MFSKIDGVKIISSFRQSSEVSAYLARRPLHGLQLMLEGACRFCFTTGENYVLEKGQVLFIPKGSSYQIELLPSITPAIYAFINFQGNIQNAAPCHFECRSLDEIKLLFNRILICQLSQTLFDHYQQLSLFFQVLALLALNESHELEVINARKIIQPALDYLHTHCFDTNLKVNNLHELCSISNPKFHKLFKLAQKTSPRKYVNNFRLSQAKHLLTENRYFYLYEIATAVGYEDALYFSRLFKQKYGYAPSIEKKMRTAPE